MGETFEISVTLPTDERGFIGRDCPVCSRYFKAKPGTGLPVHKLFCPYCGHSDDADQFSTQDQIEYARRVAILRVKNHYVDEAYRQLKAILKELERSTRGGLIQIKADVQRAPTAFRLSHYMEKEVETRVTCDHCQLEFAIYGVFGHCPDCRGINAFTIFNKSIEVIFKRLKIIDLGENDPDLEEAILKDSVSEAVSLFDSLGKFLRKCYPDHFPQRPKNLFQNLVALSDAISNSFDISLLQLLGNDKYELIFKMFQVRHIYEHNMGVIDQDFVMKLPEYKEALGRKYLLERYEVATFTEAVQDMGKKIINILNIEDQSPEISS